ncbi:hypothetical protein [Stappia sp.]|uniref:hypothetical protein n=1 Tax=Stappia sp. TaxID=1870903 RepID=UPI0032D8CC7A
MGDDTAKTETGSAILPGFCAVGGAPDGPCAWPALHEALDTVWGPSGRLDLETADSVSREEDRHPDVAIWGGETHSLNRLSKILSRARKKGLDIPLLIAGPLPNEASGRLRPVAYLAPECPAERLAERLRDVVREAVRLEEARLRRRCLGGRGARTGRQGEDPGASCDRLLVVGLSDRVAGALRAQGRGIDLVGALTADTALAELDRGGIVGAVLDAPVSRIEDVLAQIRRDPRHATLPVLAIATTVASAERLWLAGASDVAIAGLEPEALAARLRPLLLAGARRKLTRHVLARDRAAHLSGETAVPRDRFDAYLAALTGVLAARGQSPVQRPLASFHPGPMAAHVANDPDLTAAIGDPVRSAALAASREEDFIATVEGLGDIAVLRGQAAADRLSRRIAGIVGATSFG